MSINDKLALEQCMMKGLTLMINLKNDWNHGFSSDSAQQEISNEYQHGRV